MSEPCRACGIPLTYNGPVTSTDLVLDYLREILSRLRDLEAKFDAQTQNPDRKCYGCFPRCAECAPEERPAGGIEL
jgi:hypothetical protein